MSVICTGGRNYKLYKREGESQKVGEIVHYQIRSTMQWYVHTKRRDSVIYRVINTEIVIL